MWDSSALVLLELVGGLELDWHIGNHLYFVEPHDGLSGYWHCVRYSAEKNSS